MLKQAPNKSKNNTQNTRNYYLTLKSFKMTLSEGEIQHFLFQSDLKTVLIIEIQKSKFAVTQN